MARRPSFKERFLAATPQGTVLWKRRYLVANAQTNSWFARPRLLVLLIS
jgi:hypothetical protein